MIKGQPDVRPRGRKKFLATPVGELEEQAEEQARDKAMSDWEMSKIDEKDLVRELWRRGISLDYVEYAFHAMDGIASAPTQQEIEEAVENI